MNIKSAWLSFCILTVYAGLPQTIDARQLSAGDELSPVKQVVDNYMQPFLAQHNAPGAIVGISIHGRREFFRYGAATDDGSPFAPTTLVEIGSCTKVFTTTLFALAMARHQIEPDQSIQLHMPRGFTLQPVAQQVTPRQLAEFISGMPDDPTNLPRNLQMRGIDNYTVKDFLRWASRWQPASSPPASYLYSNAGIGLLSYLVAEATGTPWETQLNNEIVGPLGMVDTEMRPNVQQMRRMAQGHKANGMAAPVWPVFAWFAAGALRSTALDMLRFGEANLGHQEIDGRPVPKELISAMHTAQIPVYPLPNGKAKQGMAWVTNLGDEAGQHVEVLKNGGTVGFGTVILINPHKDAAIFIAVNQAQSNPAPIAVQIGRHLP